MDRKIQLDESEIGSFSKPSHKQRSVFDVLFVKNNSHSLGSCQHFQDYSYSSRKNVLLSNCLCFQNSVRKRMSGV